MGGARVVARRALDASAAFRMSSGEAGIERRGVIGGATDLDATEARPVGESVGRRLGFPRVDLSAMTACADSANGRL
jgi:hypothetical protein